MHPRVAVVIPVSNAALALERCLRSVRRVCGDVPLVVVDNGSDDTSTAVAARLGALVLERPHLRVGALRNEGSRACKADIVAFVDADHELTPGWLRACTAAFDDVGVGAAGRLYDAPSKGTWVQRAYECLRDRPDAATDVEWLGAGNLAVRLDAFEQAGGFDETLEACEDVDLCRRLRRAGWRIQSAPGMGSVHHGDPATLRAVFHGERWRGRNNLRVSLRERVTLRSAPGVILPVASLVLLFVTCGAALLAPRIGPWPAAAGAAALLGIALLRTALMMARSQEKGLRRLFACLAVAAAYEAGRAVALATPASHATRRQEVAARA